MRSYSRLLLVVLASAAASCSWLHGTPEQNLLVIVVDGLRFDAISESIGAAKTPNLHRLTDDGVSFTACYGHTPLSVPAITSILSARTPDHSGVLHSDQGLPSGLPLLSEVMADHGYQTFAAVSRRYDMRTATGVPADTIERGFQHFETPEAELADASDVMNNALKLVRNADAHRGWFLLAQFSDPEAPYEAYDTDKNTAHIVLDGDLVTSVSTSNSTRWKHDVELAPGKHQVSFRSANGVPVRVRAFGCEANGAPLKTSFDPDGDANAGKTVVVTIENEAVTALACHITAWVQDVPSVAQMRDRYRMEVESVDKAIGAILDDLKAREQYDNTVIVVAGSHGEALGEHGAVGAANLYDEILRVPLILKPVRDDPALPLLRKQRLTMLRLVDIAPTVLDLLGAGHLRSADGESFLDGGEREFRAEVGPPESKSRRFSIRDERYKMIYDATERRYEMYDLRVDTLELENIFMLQGHLRIAWQTTLRRMADGPNADRAPASDATTPAANG